MKNTSDKKENILIYPEDLYIKEELYLCVWQLCWRHKVLFLTMIIISVLCIVTTQNPFLPITKNLPLILTLILTQPWVWGLGRYKVPSNANHYMIIVNFYVSLRPCLLQKVFSSMCQSLNFYIFLTLIFRH